MAQIRRPVQRMLAPKKAVVADGEDVLVEEFFADQSWIAPAAPANADIDVLPVQIDEAVRSVDQDIETWTSPAQARQTRHQPVAGKGRLGRHTQLRVRTARADAPHALGDKGESAAQLRQPGACLGRRNDTAATAPEQTHAEVLLEDLDLMADRGPA